MLKSVVLRGKIGCHNQIFLVIILRGPVYHSLMLFLLALGDKDSWTLAIFHCKWPFSNGLNVKSNIFSSIGFTDMGTLS